jgi:hypothetical protein
LDVVKNAWEALSALNIWHHKLTNTTRALCLWSNSVFGEANLQFHMAQEIILRLDMAQYVRDLSEDEQELRKALKLRVLGLAAVERSRAKTMLQNYLAERRGSLYQIFHLKENVRRRKNYSASLTNNSGGLIWSHEEKNLK